MKCKASGKNGVSCKHNTILSGYCMMHYQMIQDRKNNKKETK